MCNKLQGLFYKFLKLKLSNLSAYCSAHVKCLCLLITIAHRGINHGSKSGGRTCETRRAEARSPTGWERGEVLGRGQPAPSPSSHPPPHQLGAEGLGERCNWKLPQWGSGRRTHTSRNPPVFTAFTWPIGHTSELLPHSKQQLACCDQCTVARSLAYNINASYFNWIWLSIEVHRR